LEKQSLIKIGLKTSWKNIVQSKWTCKTSNKTFKPSLE